MNSVHSIALCCLMVLLGLGSYVQARAADQQNRIIYVRAPDDRAPLPVQDIYSVNADGTDDHALTNDGHSHSPQVSPDGKQILFIHDTALQRPPQHREMPGFESYHSTELCLMDSNGGHRRVLLYAEGGVKSGVWSPDGRSIGAGYCPNPQRDEKCGFYVMPAEGEGPGQRLLGNVLDARWSPDGTKVAATVREPGDSPTTLHVVNADGSHDISLVRPEDNSQFAVFGAWSPDSQKIIYSVVPAGQSYSLYVAKADGSERVEIGDPRHYPTAIDGAWSPDGKLIAFDAFKRSERDERMGQQEIFLANADGTNVHVYTADPDWGCVAPSWSADGKEMTFFCRAYSAPCADMASGPPSTRRLGCERRVFVTSSTDPISKLTPIIDHDGAGPAFLSGSDPE